ncbi:mitochondrial carrier domain-containing protein [Nemania sp. FL0031]|nr:mitochondrial carrier domain-containing protein [Nemania sp. FL0031]
MPPSSPSSSPPLLSTDNANSVLPALHHALSGSLGTLISTWSLYPLSLMTARLQVQRQQERRRRRRGPGGPHHGPAARAPAPEEPGRAPVPAPSTPPPTTPAPTSPPLGEEAPPSEQASTQAPVRDQDRDPRQPRPTAKNPGLGDVFLQIWNSDGDGGLRAFYTGLAQDAPKSVLDSFLFFLFYEWFRSLRLRSRRRAGRVKGRGLGVVEELAVGMAAGACSRTFTMPIATIVTRKQTATVLDPNGSLGVREIVRNIRKEKGIAGFWSGYSASLVLTLNPGLTFFLQEFLRTISADQTYDDPGPRLTFLFAATSKAISSFITYPLQIAKTGLQAGIPMESAQSDEGQLNRANEVNRNLDHRAEGGQGTEVEAENKPKIVDAVQHLAQRSVFGTLAHIIQSERIGSLYDGIGAELLKSFLSHGITMLAKDAVHKSLFKAYIYTLEVLVALRKRRFTKTNIL